MLFLLAQVIALKIANADELVDVKVRLLKADDKSMIGFKSFVDKDTFDPQLSDLKDQLDSLPFERYVLLSTKEIILPLKKKETIQFSCGQALHIRPLVIDGEKISLWLNWEDSNGQNILDTRMHFDSNRSMLAGTDSAGDTGMILAVSVNPRNTP